MPRTEKFYLEFISLTVLSLLAANVWIRFVMRLLDNHADSLSVDLVMAVVITGMAFLLMRYFFTHKTDGEVDEPTHRGELFDNGEEEK